MSERRGRTLLARLATGFLMAAAIVGAASAADKPNIVFMLTDNLGYGELGVYGGGVLRGAPTPRIDALATQGMRLLNFNVEAQCTPSRAALMTGRFPIRSGAYAVAVGGMADGLTPWEVTIAQLLSAQGYATSAQSRFRRVVRHPAHLRRKRMGVFERDQRSVAVGRRQAGLERDDHAA
jgi:arylsulfatase